ncbi:MAG: NADH-quinone oxidoreductase subunit J [Epsilonproteobacteria bacterium]|nr:MAG: NADH-quinone oxidoreductase subunit J [Campylobacterota bacterium]
MTLLLLTAVLMLAAASLIIKRSVPAMISFALMMFLLGLYYISLDAKVLGLFQIFIYTGGIVVLMLFGVTIIGVEFPKAASRPWAAFSALLVFIALSTLFFRGVDTLVQTSDQPTENIHLFAQNFSDIVILFALIGSSLLYGTIKMSATLKTKRSKNV